MAGNSPPQAPAPEAPWYFRKRFTVFALIYGSSFPLGFLIAGLAGQPAQPAYKSSGHPLLFGSIALVGALGGYALRVWASSHLEASVVWQQDVRLHELRVSGPYRFTRNPLYLGNLMQAVGIGLMGAWPVLLLLLVGMLIFTLALVSTEERFLSQTSGPAYAEYRSRVPRLIPLPWKMAPEGGHRGSLRDGFRSEIMTATFAAAVTVILLLTWPR